MQSVRKPVEKKPKEKTKEDKLKSEEKIKKTFHNVSTPRDFVQRSSAADIYAQKRKPTIQNTPRKVPGTSREIKASPMKDLLKSSPSSISQISNSSRISTSSKVSSVKARTAKDLPFVNVTVNSPIARRKLDLDIKTPRVNEAAKGNTVNLKSRESTKKITVNKKEKEILDRGDIERQRSKTRTLNENEVKQLTPDKVDNNEEMMNLKQKLIAKPKAFYVGLDGETSKVQPDKPSDEEVSYEDDFESYESDFDSYHSEKSNGNTSVDAEPDIEQDGKEDKQGSEADAKEARDEENMLDSGSFDLREQRSAKSKPAAMEYILEGSEDDRISSLDEGFQEGSSGVSSMRTVHVDVLDRLMFVDFNKSNEKKRKKLNYEKMMQRANDILSMVTLHEMSFTLFEMKPISYDLYMATFGRSNHTQIAVQTFEDGITEEVQTEEVSMDSKWTQHPVKFSKFDVYLNKETDIRKKNRRNSEDYLSKFTFLFENKIASEENDLDTLKEYKENPLRVLLEQRNGVGNCEMLPRETYKSKLNADFSIGKLGKFLKKVESNVGKVLSSNANGAVLENVIKSAFPFSSGYIGITTKNVSDEKSFLKQSKIIGIIFSETKHNLVLTVHRKATSGVMAGRCLVCLWDASVARAEPIKMLIAIDNVVIGRCRGSTDGMLVGALEDGSMHLWDLSEVPSWRNDVASSRKTDLVEMKTEALTQTEKDREWNLKNSDAIYKELPIPFSLQACAYTSSAANMQSLEPSDQTVGLEFIGDGKQNGGRRVVGQICSLQRLGALTIWTIVQEKTKTHDPGKAFCSKMKLERTQTISLTDNISAREFLNDTNSIFNLNAGKKRMLNRKQEKTLARNFSRQKSSDSLRDRPTSVASARKVPVEKRIPNNWESGVVCSDLKITQYNGADRYLVAKNYGEVLSCTRSLGAFKVERLCVSSDTSPITCLEVSRGAGSFLAATDSGTVHLYSMVERRVLLTLDCRNGAPAPAPVGPRADFKGSFVDTPQKSQAVTHTNIANKMTVTAVLWSRINPCCIFTLSQEGALGAWDLTHSDIYPKYSGGKATVACMAADGTLALVTGEGDVQIHRLSHERTTVEYEQARGTVLPPLSAVYNNVSILFVNSHPVLAPAQSFPPNVVDIGGFHIEEDTSLSEDLKQLLDSNNFIYFSLGSVVKMSSLSACMKSDLARMFEELPYTVLWKSDEPLTGLAKNVHVRSWLPQPGILAHPNIKLFITHGGLLSTIEAVHYGVPLLAVPVFGDQLMNAAAGYARRVDFDAGMAGKLRAGMQEMIRNDSYYNTVKHLTKLLHSRPVAPSKLISHYVELAIESKGAYHLRSPSRHYHWWQRRRLDQLFGCILFIYGLYTACRIVLTETRRLLKSKTD